MPQVNDMSWMYTSFSLMPLFFLLVLTLFFSCNFHYYLYLPLLSSHSFKVVI